MAYREISLERIGYQERGRDQFIVGCKQDIKIRHCYLRGVGGAVGRPVKKVKANCKYVLNIVSLINQR